MPSIFIETTIHIQRLIAEPETQAFIENIVHTNKTVTSSYVWMEFHRTIGQDYQYLIGLFRQNQPQTVLQLLKYIGNSEDLFSLRRVKRLLHISSKLLEQVDVAHFDPFEVADLLEAERGWLLNHQFFEGIDQVVNSTACDLIQPSYSIPSGGRMSCRRETARCSLLDLLDKNSAAIQNLQADSTALDALESNTQRALSEITLDSAMAKGERNCWSLGDVIIALECPDDAALWTTNMRHFEPIGRAFGKQLFRPDQVAS